MFWILIASAPGAPGEPVPELFVDRLELEAVKAQTTEDEAKSRDAPKSLKLVRNVSLGVGFASFAAGVSLQLANVPTWNHLNSRPTVHFASEAEYDAALAGYKLRQALSLTCYTLSGVSMSVAGTIMIVSPTGFSLTARF